jgi:3',5'-cyclic AMP phosphodiesterase CpdA
VVLVTLADLHIGADWFATDPLQTLSAIVDAVRRLDVAVDAVLVLGDVAEHGSDDEYARALTELERLDAPLHLAMGNRDDREVLRRRVGHEPASGAPLHYAADLGAARLIVLDTTIPGRDGGELDRDRMAWLERELAAGPRQPTVLAMHHPPLLTGAPVWDAIALSEPSRAALADVLAGHPQVRLLVGGHLHRPLITEFSERPLIVAPSTYVQFPLRLRATRLEAADEPPGYAVHVVADAGQATSYFLSAA